MYENNILVVQFLNILSKIKTKINNFLSYNLVLCKIEIFIIILRKYLH